RCVRRNLCAMNSPGRGCRNKPHLAVFLCSALSIFVQVQHEIPWVACQLAMRAMVLVNARTVSLRGAVLGGVGIDAAAVEISRAGDFYVDSASMLR
ncbi:hypothetical protein AB4144_53440, partial [Rhizobiaceae sp. 2RAB30]